MIPLAVLLFAGAVFLAASALWVRVLDGRHVCESIPYALADTEWLADPAPTFQQLYDRVEVEDMHEWFDLPSPVDER